MNTYIALLRAIGGKYTFPMKELVSLLEGIGFSQVRTYIQSGNAVFQSGTTEPSTLSGKIQSTIQKSYGFAPQVIILKPDELGEAIASNPYREAESEPTTLHLTFLASVPKNPDLTGLERLRADSERFSLKGRVFYFHAPNGVGRSKLFARVEKSLGVSGTARNWRTVCKLKAMVEQYDVF